MGKRGEESVAEDENEVNYYGFERRAEWQQTNSSIKGDLFMKLQRSQRSGMIFEKYIKVNARAGCETKMKESTMMISLYF